MCTFVMPISILLPQSFLCPSAVIIFLCLHGQVLPNTVIEVWKGGNNWGPEMAAVTKSGLKAVLSACWYLNYISYGTDWEKVGCFSVCVAVRVNVGWV